jgi:sugar lactone lactonase YvrE
MLEDSKLGQALRRNLSASCASLVIVVIGCEGSVGGEQKNADAAGAADARLTGHDGGGGDAGPDASLSIVVTVSTLAGSGTKGFGDGPGGAALFGEPKGTAVDALGYVYVADDQNNRMRKIEPNGDTSTLAGNGTIGFNDGSGGPNGTAQLYHPFGTAVDAHGYVYVAEFDGNRIRKITPNGTTSTLAGGMGVQGYVDGSGGPNGTTRFFIPHGVAVDSLGNVYVGDTGNNRVRKVAPNGTTSTLAGNGTAGFTDGSAGTASFSNPWGVAVDAQGNVYVADSSNSRIRKIAPNGVTSTLAGNGTVGFADGSGGPNGTAQFHAPEGIAVDAQGNVYVGDTGNNRIRKIALDGMTSTLAGDGTGGFADGPGGAAQFHHPSGLAVDAQGNIYVADLLNNRIRKVTITTDSH